MYVCVCIYVCIVGGSKQKYNLRNNLTTYFNIKRKYSSHSRDVPYLFACRAHVSGIIRSVYPFVVNNVSLVS